MPDHKGKLAKMVWQDQKGTLVPQAQLGLSAAQAHPAHQDLKAQQGQAAQLDRQARKAILALQAAREPRD